MRSRRFLLMLVAVLASITVLTAQWGRWRNENPPPDPQFLPHNPDHEYSFARLVYYTEGARYGWYAGWDTDYPKADFQFLMGVRRLSRVDAHDGPVDMRLDDPRLFNYPFLYAVEPGYMLFSDAEVLRLREYLARGGFFVVDDFHGTSEWEHFERQIRRVLPDKPIIDLPMTHPIFQCHFNIKEKIQVPGAQYLRSGSYSEKGGVVPYHRAILDDDGRILVMINHNMDLGDAWEWADVPEYEERFTTQAYHLGINYIVYSMTH